MIEVVHHHPWLEARLPRSSRCLSWAPYRPGFQTTERILWREVRDADLTEDFDALSALAREVAQNGAEDCIGLLTSRDVSRYHRATAEVGQATACCVATIGLSNAVHVGTPERTRPIGTINLLAWVNTPLSDVGLIETMSIATEARTGAVMEHGPMLSGGRATGTGTDCVVVAAPEGKQDFAGLHTKTGQAIGAAVFEAVAAGVREWMNEIGSKTDG